MRSKLDGSGLVCEYDDRLTPRFVLLITPRSELHLCSIVGLCCLVDTLACLEQSRRLLFAAPPAPSRLRE